MENILNKIEELNKEEKKLQLLELDSEINTIHDINKQFYIVKNLRRELVNMITEYKRDNDGEITLKPNLMENDISETFFFETFGRKIIIDKEKVKPMTREKIVKQYSALSDKSLKDSYKMYDSFDTDEDIVNEFIKVIDKSKRDRVYVDIETTDVNSCFGDIIEIGILVVDPNGKVIETYERRFDLTHPDKTIKYKAGVGVSDVHKIYPEDLEGLKDFHDKEVQSEIYNMICKPNRVLVAHNDDFEYKWLETHLDGFFETYNKYSNESIKRGFEPINGMLDTRIISQFLFHDSPNSKLESFVEGMGMEYEDAHSAFPDAKMTYEAFEIFKNRFKNGRPESLKVSDEIKQ